MLLDISSALREQEVEIPFTHEETVPPQMILGELITFDEPVLLKGTFCLIEKRLLLRGTIETTVHAQCANCLTPVSLSLTVPFDEVFQQIDRRRPSEETEDEEQLTFEGYQIELEQLTLTLILLDLPIRFLCKNDCPGFSDKLQQMNEQANACQDELDHEHPFAALQQLLTKDQEV